MNINKIMLWGMAMLMASCSADEVSENQQQGIVSFSTSIEHYEGELISRSNLMGNAFEEGDKIKLKIIAGFFPKNHRVIVTKPVLCNSWKSVAHNLIHQHT